MQSRVILLVEDNSDDEVITLEALNSGGVKNPIEVARDGSEALDYLFCQGAHSGRDPRQPVLVLLDLKLPKISGHEVLRRLRSDETTALIPVVILTTSSEPDDINKSYRFGANSYVRKEVDFRSFLDALQVLGKYWLEINEPPSG